MPDTEMHMVDGKLDGPFMQRDEHGRLLLRGQFRNGLLEGPLQMLRPDGQIDREMQFRQGQLHGQVIIHEPNQPPKIMQFDKGQHIEQQVQPSKDQSRTVGWFKTLKRRLWR